MYLYELAMELGERSADIADRAEALGLEGISPAAEVTPEQAQAIRAAYSKGQVTPDPAGGSPLAGAPVAAAAKPKKPRDPRTTQRVAIAIAVAAVLGGLAFFVSQTGGDEERQQEISADLQNWKDAPAATISEEAKAEAARQIPNDKPIDQDALCASRDVTYQQEVRPRGTPDELRVTALDNGLWGQAVADMARFGPVDARDRILAYRDLVVKYDQVIAEANHAELRDYLEGKPRVGLADRDAEVAKAKAAVDALVVPFCGQPEA